MATSSESKERARQVCDNPIWIALANTPETKYGHQITKTSQSHAFHYHSLPIYTLLTYLPPLTCLQFPFSLTPFFIFIPYFD